MSDMILATDSILGPPTRADAAYIEVRNRILLGTLEPGSHIDYRELCESLKLSVTPLREALRRLESDHLVIRNAHRDVSIALLTEDEARELLMVRENLDVLAARLASQQMTDEEIRTAKNLVETRDDVAAIRYLRAADVPVAVGGLLTITRAFHRMVYCGSHNSVIIQYRDNISARTERYVIVASRIVPFDVKRWLPFYEQIVEALEARDADLAEKATRAYGHESAMNFADIIFDSPGVEPRDR